MAGFLIQKKNKDGTMSDLPLVATYDSSGNKISDAYVSKVSGKGLSTNDYTTNEKTKLSKAVTTDGTQTITGDKTTTGVLKIQNGSPSGAFVLGADCQYKTLTANFRKLGRMGVPSYDSTTKTVAGISFDAQVNTNYADFGGHPLNSSSIAPDVIRFTVADAHNNTVNGARTLALQISKQNNLADSVSSAVPKSFAGAEFFVPVKVGGNLSATSITENGTALSNKYVAQVSGKGLSTNDYTTAEKNKLNGLSNYTLPKATYSALGGVIVDYDTIKVNSNTGKISLDASCISTALGYSPVSAIEFEGVKSSVSNKADKYISSGGAKILSSTDVNAYNLRGATISGIPNSTIDLNSFQSFQISNGAGTVTYEVQMGGAMGEIVLYRNGGYVTSNEGETMYFYHGYDGQDGQYYARTYTFPSDDDFYITSDSTSLKDFQVGESITVDCEYNYKNKANVYKTTAGGGLRSIQVGDDLSGKTVYFDTTKVTNDLTSAYPISVDTSSKNNFVYGSISPPSISINGTEVFHYSSGWAYSSMTLPSTAGTVTSITGDVGQFIQIASTTEVSVDCEYNYNEIQTVKTEVETVKTEVNTLKEQVNNSGGGGGAIYRHLINFGFGGPYGIEPIVVYSSSPTPIETGAQAYELMKNVWYPTYTDSMDGAGMVVVQVTSSSVLSIKGAIWADADFSYVYDTVTQV